MDNKKRLIDVDRLIQDINADIYRTESEKSYVRCLASRQPTVDAVEVVRCKDCKCYKPEQKRCDHERLEWEVECYDLWLNMEPDDFCSYGERKDNDNFSRN